MTIGKTIALIRWTFVGKVMAQMVKKKRKMPAMQETWVQSLVWEDLLEKEMAPVFLPEVFHGQRRLAGYRLWGCKVRQDLENEQQ